MNYENIITIEPGKRGGKPGIRWMRITVCANPVARHERRGDGCNDWLRGCAKLFGD